MQFIKKLTELSKYRKPNPPFFFKKKKFRTREIKKFSGCQFAKFLANNLFFKPVLSLERSSEKN